MALSMRLAFWGSRFLRIFRSEAFDDIEVSAEFVPALTTVAQPMADLGRVAARYMLDVLSGADPTVLHRQLPARLVTRSSTAMRNQLQRSGDIRGSGCEDFVHRPGPSHLLRAYGSATPGGNAKIKRIISIDRVNRFWYRYHKLKITTEHGKEIRYVKRINFCVHFTRWIGDLVLATVLVLAPLPSQAVLVTYDGLMYIPSGPLTIDGLPNDGTQASNGWDNVTWGQFLSGATSYIITNGSLADPTGLLFRGSNSVYTTGGFAGRFFTTPANWATPGITMYFSILIRPTVTPATNHYYGLQIFSNDANTGNGHDLFVGKNGSGLNWGLEYTTNFISGSTTLPSVDAYSSMAAAANQTVLLVVRVIFAFRVARFVFISM